jgi:hypothetical protein
MGKPRTELSKQKARKSMLQTSFERSRKVREHDKLVQERRVLIDLVREGIACGGSTRQFLRWIERAKFIIGNEPASSQETCEQQNTSGDAGNHAGWDRGGGASASASGETRPAELCGCYSCSDFHRRMTVMITCPECGNKRCPKATHHIHACTNSNAPGQPGSRYYEDVDSAPNRGESR